MWWRCYKVKFFCCIFVNLFGIPCFCIALFYFESPPYDHFFWLLVFCVNFVLTPLPLPPPPPRPLDLIYFCYIVTYYMCVQIILIMLQCLWRFTTTNNFVVCGWSKGVFPLVMASFCLLYYFQIDICSKPYLWPCWKLHEPHPHPMLTFSKVMLHNARCFLFLFIANVMYSLEFNVLRPR
jgi:hypothetical protein